MIKITSEHANDETRVCVEMHGNGADVKRELIAVPSSLLVNFGKSLMMQGCPRAIARKETEDLLKCMVKYIEETMTQSVKDGDI